MYDVIGIGCCALDILLEADRLPRADEKLRARRVAVQGGGLVATALVHPTNGSLTPSIQADVEDILDEHLARVDTIRTRILDRELTLF